MTKNYNFQYMKMNTIPKKNRYLILNKKKFFFLIIYFIF